MNQKLTTIVSILATIGGLGIAKAIDRRKMKRKVKQQFDSMK